MVAGPLDSYLQGFDMTNNLFNRLQKQPAYKIVGDALQQAIMQRQLKIGDALPIESSLAEQFGVNRSTVREGIRHLEQQGLVERQGKKLIVTRPTSNAVADQMSNVLILHDVTFQELWEMEMALEPLAAQLAATQIDQNSLAIIKKNLDATEHAIEQGDRHSITALDVEFHHLIAEAANNQALNLSREALARLFYPAYQASMHNETSEQRLIEAHRFIYNALVNKDAQNACEWMKKHIVDFKRGYELAGNDLHQPLQV